MKKEKKESLGFIFGFKQTEKKDDNQFNVLFKTGISQKFPKKYEKEKDFWSSEIFAGQFSELYINPKNYEEAFYKELEEIENNKAFIKEEFQKRRYFFDYDIKENQYNALHAFSMAILYINMNETWENDNVLKETLKNTIQKYFENDKRDILDIYKDYQKVSDYIYQKEISEALGEINNATKVNNKPKI